MPRPPALQPLPPQLLVTLRRMLDEEAVIRSMPEGWVVCWPNGLSRSLLYPEWVHTLVLAGLVTADHSQPAATYRLTAAGVRAYYAGGCLPRPDR